MHGKHGYQRPWLGAWAVHTAELRVQQWARQSRSGSLLADKGNDTERLSPQSGRGWGLSTRNRPPRRWVRPRRMVPPHVPSVIAPKGQRGDHLADHHHSDGEQNGEYEKRSICTFVGDKGIPVLRQCSSAGRVLVQVPPSPNRR